MEARDLVRSQLGLAGTVLEIIMADVTQELAMQAPAGNIQSIGAIYAHAIVDLDFIVNHDVLGNPMLIAQGDWSARTGIPVPSTGLMTPEWLAALKLNLPAAQEYAKALIAAVDSAIASAPAAVLKRKMDGPFGKITGLEAAGGVGIYHLSQHSGEIAALKGVLGCKGMPF